MTADGSFSDRLRLVMGATTQPEMAARLGVPQTSLSRYLRGESSPSAEFLRALAQREHVDIGWLLTGCPTTPADGSLGDLDLTNVSTEVIVSELKRRLRDEEQQALATLTLAVEMLKRLDKLRFDESPKTPEK